MTSIMGGNLAGPKFLVSLKILELNKMPQTVGSVMVKWYLKDSPKPEARGRTPRKQLQDHKGVWNYETSTTVRIGTDKKKVLRPTEIVFDVLWENIGSNRINIGKLQLNLSEYVDRPDTSHIYLLHDSKVNCTLTLQLKLTHMKGTSDYIVPEFTAPQLCTDISDVLDEKRAKENFKGSEFHKRLCRNLTVEWHPRPGHLTAADAIENIFKGGTGFGDEESKNCPTAAPPPWHGLLSEIHERDNFQSWKVRETIQ